MASLASSASSSSSASASICYASLVDPVLHTPALLELIDLKISIQVIEYTIDRVVKTVDHAMGRLTPSLPRGTSTTGSPDHAKFTTLVADVLTRAEVTMPTLLVTLVYVDRVRPHLHIALEQWALERVFLGALIVASKYANDSTLKNVHWANCTGLFSKSDVNLIEREYLNVLNFELKITEDDLLTHYGGLSETTPLSTRRPLRTLALPASTFSSPLASTTDYSNSIKKPERRSQRRRPTTYVLRVPGLSPPSLVSSPESNSSYLLRTPSFSSSNYNISSAKATPYSHHWKRRCGQCRLHRRGAARSSRLSGLSIYPGP